MAFVSGPDRSSIVQLCFKPLAAAKTLVLYIGAQPVIPPRSPASFVPHTATAIAVTYSPPYNQHPRPRPLHLKIASASAIARVATSVNALARDIALFHNGPQPFDGETATLVFQLQAEKPITVDVDPSDRIVHVRGFPWLADPANSVWRTLTAIMPPTGYVPFRGGFGAR